MAPRKTTRKKRTARGKSSGRSTSSVITVGAIVVIGATAVWATSQNKSPTTSVTHFFQNALSTSSRPSTVSSLTSTHRPTQPPDQAAQTPRTQIQKNQIQAQPHPVPLAAVQPSPAPKPPLSLGNPVQQPQTSRINTAPIKSAQDEIKLAPAMVTNLPPAGKSSAADNSRHSNGAFKVPKVVTARQTLVIREKAWDQAKKIGGVEKGREMRSYAKVGRWHRVVVPSTNIIGWVQEDQLVLKN